VKLQIVSHALSSTRRLLHHESNTSLENDFIFRQFFGSRWWLAQSSLNFCHFVHLDDLQAALVACVTPVGTAIAPSNLISVHASHFQSLSAASQASSFFLLFQKPQCVVSRFLECVEFIPPKRDDRAPCDGSQSRTTQHVHVGLLDATRNAASPQLEDQNDHVGYRLPVLARPTGSLQPCFCSSHHHCTEYNLSFFEKDVNKVLKF
jgi:hypothetical protein